MNEKLEKIFSEEEIEKKIKEGLPYASYGLVVKINNDGKIEKNKFMQRFLPPFNIDKKTLSRTGRIFLKSVEKNKNHFFLSYDKKTGSRQYYEEIYPTPKEGCVFKSISEDEEGNLSYFVYNIKSNILCCKYSSNDDFEEIELISKIMPMANEESKKILRQEFKNRNLDLDNYRDEPLLKFIHHFSIHKESIHFYVSLDLYHQGEEDEDYDYDD